MESKTNIYHLWIQYTTQNEEKYFWQFVNGFVDIWEKQCGIDYVNPPLWSQIKPDSVPILAKLPDELLAAIGKFLYISKEKCEKNSSLSLHDLDEVNLLFRCLFIICRNFDNIPLIASCDYVSLSEPIAAGCINKLTKSSVGCEIDVDGVKSIVSAFCHFLEGMYDPYLTWRNYLTNQTIDFTKLLYKPSLLHVEVIPFIYDCFQTECIFLYPSLCIELLNVLGATISGSQHNALRSVCPATVNLVIRIISTLGIDKNIRQIALDCFTVMVQVLYKSTPEQRQIELSLILEMYTDSMKKIISGNIVKSDTSFKLEDNIKVLSSIPSEELQTDNRRVDSDELSYMLCTALVTIRRLLEDFEASRAALCQLMVDFNYIHILIALPDCVNELELDKKLLGIECVKTLTRLLSCSRTAKKKPSDKCDYDTVVSKWISLGDTSKELLQEFVYMAMDGERNNNADIPLCNPEVVIALLKNMIKMNEDDQAWLSHKLTWLCTKNLRSKWLACRKGTISPICDVLISYDKSIDKPVITLINLLDNLACVSITAMELKKIFFLLRQEKEFSHKIPLLHTLCNVTRRGDKVCKAFLDIRKETDGINVPNINKWNNTSYGFTFHCWICLDRLPESHDAYGKHRQLLNLLTQSSQGLEVFIDQSGVLFINILKKNSLQTASVPSAGLNDNRWHCVSICIAYARRALTYNQISVFIDGTQRLAVSMKFQSFDDVFAHCYIGAPLGEAAKQINKKPEVEKESFHGHFVKSIFSNQFLPSIVLQAPSYLSFGSSSRSGQSNAIDSSHGMLNQVPLHGHISHVSLFNDILTLSSAKWLYEAGIECHNLLCAEEGADSQEMYNRLVFCYSAMATWDGTCLNLGPSITFNGFTKALRVFTTSVKEVINAISNIYVLFPLLEDLSITTDKDIDLDVFCGLSSPCEFDTQNMKDWEVLPSNYFSEWKLDQNPVSMFLTLLKNTVISSSLNQEELVKNDGLVIVGNLLCQCKPVLIDVNVLMTVQQFIETVRDLPQPILLKALYQNVLFNFNIWSHSLFHIRIAHIQYISNFVKQDKNYFRKNFGLQYMFDVIRTHYLNEDMLSSEDAKTIRLALLGIIRYFISKDINIKELLTILGFLVSVKEENLLIEAIEMLLNQMTSKNCRDQIYLLLHEQFTGEILYVLLLSKNFSDHFKVMLSKFLHLILRTDRVHSRNKSTMLLQDSGFSMFPGLIGYMDPKSVSIDLAAILFDLMCTGETKGGYAGILALLHLLSYESIDMKMELAKKLLTATFINLNAPFIIAKLVGWQDCIARLLVKRCISDITLVEEAVDLMTFDEESLKLEPDSSFHHSHIPSLSEAANVWEHEIKEIAGSVSEAVADNLQYAADNLTTAVASVCSVIRQKTVDIQESLGELGHISRTHLPSFAENDSIEFSVDNDSVIISNRSVSSLSIDDVGVSDSSSHKMSLYAESSKQSEAEAHLPHDLDLGDKCINKEENLSYLVANILFTVLWRGVEGFSKDSWKERGQVMACINLLALNNELYCSHLQLRLRLLEMGVQAALVDLKEPGMFISGAKANALHLMRLIYDLVVLDPNKDDTKKCSSKLLDGVLALLDALKVFSEDDSDPLRQELARLGLGVLVACATGSETRTSLAAPACALLHSLLRSSVPISGESDIEAAYLICSISSAMKSSIEAGNNEQYSFLMPVMKALLEKVALSMNVDKYLPDLPSFNMGPVFFNEFEEFIKKDQWSNFIEYKVRPLSIAYDRETSRLVAEPLNTFWAECYEACKAGAQARARDQMHAKTLFQNHVVSAFRTRQSEDLQRYSNVQTQQKSRSARAAATWKTKRAFLTGPRGAWCSGEEVSKFWRLSPHENLSRMRLKLDVLNSASKSEQFTAAARLRDNLGRSNSTSGTTGSIQKFAPPRAPQADDDFLADEDIKLSIEPEVQSMETGKEKMIVSQECELITLMTKFKGRLDVTTNYLYFHDLSPIKEDVERQDFTISLSQLREIHLRRYNLRRSALEIFLLDQTNYFLNFTTKTRNGVFSRILGLQPPNILYGSGQSPSELLKASGLTQKWINREITNFDYLMHLNMIAGRTYNDLSQYPVYPWILADYHSEILDLENPATFRNLSKPIGVVNPKNEAEVRAKYDNFEDPTGVISKFHYGTHYSNSAGVLHYLLRVEPFTSLHIELQSGRFDVADRQFHSIAQTWKMLMNNPNDVKELTPEFFYFPEFLKNINNLDLGILQGTSYHVGEVALPPWAEGSAEHFVYLHRKALESEYVSENLHHWIDLIFGYKQRGPRAVEALNVFYYCSYEGAVDLDAIADPGERAAVEGMIANFGQVPAQLIRSSPHPQRLTAKRAAARALRGEVRTLPCLHLLAHLTISAIQISRTDEPIVWLGGPCRGRGFLQGGGRWLTALSRNGIMYTPVWQPFSLTGQALEPESSGGTLKNRRQISIIGENKKGINNQAIAMSSDGKIVYTGGHWDCSIKVYGISNKVKFISTVKRHFGPVTCLALDVCSEHWLVSGSADSTIAIWEIGTNPGNPQLKNFFHGHDGPVTCVAVMAELDVVVSGSEDGTVNVYTLKKGDYVHTLYPKGCQGVDITVKYIVLSHQGHIGFIVNDQIYNSVHVFNINGFWRASRNVCGRVTALCSVGDCFLIADDAGDITISTSHSLKPVYDVPLHVPIEHVLITPHNTHILVATRDGRVFIIGLPPPNKNSPSLIETL